MIVELNPPKPARPQVIITLEWDEADLVYKALRGAQTHPTISSSDTNQRNLQRLVGQLYDVGFRV